jgi:SAM-dependent methyltransferase
VEYGLPLLLSTIELVPERLRGGDILQLGAEPYFVTLCLRRSSARQTLVNYFGGNRRHGHHVLTHRRTGEQLRLDYDLFNAETEDFPYLDATFDVVIMSELIEHFAVNPVRTLYEIHRVLRPDGFLVVTTPNAISLRRGEEYLRAQGEMVDHYSPAFGYGARHNREYRPYELRQVLECTGFTIDVMFVRDLIKPPWRQRLSRTLWRRFLAWHSDQPRGDHIFVRARRAPRFRWSFPPCLFDHMEFYVLVREPWVEMGINDSIQCGMGWSPLEEVPGNGSSARRWTIGEGQALLRCPDGAARVRVDCFAPAAPGDPCLPVRVIVRHRWAWSRVPSLLYADAIVPVVRGEWCTVTLPLLRHPATGAEIEVNISPQLQGDDPPALTGVPGPGRGLAVRRIWLDSN